MALFFCVMELLICKYELSDKKSKCRVSDTQVTFKARGPLVYSTPSHFSCRLVQQGNGTEDLL